LPGQAPDAYAHVVFVIGHLLILEVLTHSGVRKGARGEGRGARVLVDDGGRWSAACSRAQFRRQPAFAPLSINVHFRPRPLTTNVHSCSQSIVYWCPSTSTSVHCPLST